MVKKRWSAPRGKSTAKTVGSFFLLLIFALAIAWGSIWFWHNYVETGAIQVPTPQPQQPAGVAQPPVETPVNYVAPIYGVVVDYFTKDTLGSTSAKVDVIDPANLKSAYETITVDTSSEKYQSGKLYSAGTTWKFHVYSTEGNGYYDALYDVTIPSYPSRISGTDVFYIQNPELALKQRVATANFAARLLDPTGATLSSATGNTAGSTGSYTASSTNVNLRVSITITGTTSQPVAWGVPMPYINAQNQLEELKPVMWVAVNSTAVNMAGLEAQGFQPITNPPTGWLVYYKFLDPLETTKTTTTATQDVLIPLDLSNVASGTKVAVYVWMADLQRPNIGTLNSYVSSLTAYGAFSGLGVSTPLPNKGYTESSGAPANPYLAAVVTAP